MLCQGRQNGKILNTGSAQIVEDMGFGGDGGFLQGKHLGNDLPHLGEQSRFLTLCHSFHIFLEGNQLALLVAVEQQQILGSFLVGTVVGDGAVLELTAEDAEELVILLPVVLQKALQLISIRIHFPEECFGFFFSFEMLDSKISEDFKLSYEEL